jgi:prevent-host-death family protein
MDVGVRELKKRLSEYIDRASRGEVIRVTHRGRPRALLCPIDSAGAAVEEGIDQGWITAGSGDRPEPVARHRSRRRTDDVLAGDRDR